MAMPHTIAQPHPYYVYIYSENVIHDSLLTTIELKMKRKLKKRENENMNSRRTDEVPQFNDKLQFKFVQHRFKHLSKHAK